MLLGTLLPSFYMWGKFWLEGKVWCLKAVSVPAYSVTFVAHLPCPCSLNSHVLWTHWDSVLLGHRERYTQLGHCGQVNVGYLLCYMLAPLSHQTLLQKHKFKYKIIKNFKAGTVEHWTKCSGSLLCTGPVWKHGVGAREAGTDYHFYLTLLWKFWWWRAV